MPYPATVNDEAMYKHAKSVGETLLGQPNVKVLLFGLIFEHCAASIRKPRDAN